jgi:hypothetical protein
VRVLGIFPVAVLFFMPVYCTQRVAQRVLCLPIEMPKYRSVKRGFGRLMERYFGLPLVKEGMASLALLAVCMLWPCLS